MKKQVSPSMCSSVIHGAAFIDDVLWCLDGPTKLAMSRCSRQLQAAVISHTSTRSSLQVDIKRPTTPAAGSLGLVARLNGCLHLRVKYSANGNSRTRMLAILADAAMRVRPPANLGDRAALQVVPKPAQLNCVVQVTLIGQPMLLDAIVPDFLVLYCPCMRGLHLVGVCFTRRPGDSCEAPLQWAGLQSLSLDSLHVTNVFPVQLPQQLRCLPNVTSLRCDYDAFNSPHLAACLGPQLASLHLLTPNDPFLQARPHLHKVFPAGVSYHNLQRLAGDITADDAAIQLLLQSAPGLTHLSMGCIQLSGNLANKPCSWKQLEVAGPVEVATLARLPLSRLTHLSCAQGIYLSTYYFSSHGPDLDEIKAFAKSCSDVQVVGPTKVYCQGADTLPVLMAILPLLSSVQDRVDLHCAEQISKEHLAALGTHLRCSALGFIDCTWQRGVCTDMLTALPHVTQLSLLRSIPSIEALSVMCSKAAQPVTLCLNDQDMTRMDAAWEGRLTAAWWDCGNEHVRLAVEREIKDQVVEVDQGHPDEDEDTGQLSCDECEDDDGDDSCTTCSSECSSGDDGDRERAGTCS